MSKTRKVGLVIKDFLLDLIFPKFCVGCGKEGKWICGECNEEIVLVSSQVCPSCGRISEHGRYCCRCRPKHRLTGVLAAAYYDEGPIKEAVHNLKYNNVTELADFLGKLMSRALEENKTVLGKGIIVTAVPMFWLKRSQRGYNQAELLATKVSLAAKLEKNLKILKKIKNTKSQVSKSGKNRLKNLQKSIKISNDSLVKNRSILIVDDVITTGTTLEECAKVLKAAGAKKVWGLVVARG